MNQTSYWANVQPLDALNFNKNKYGSATEKN